MTEYVHVPAPTVHSALISLKHRSTVPFLTKQRKVSNVAFNKQISECSAHKMHTLHKHEASEWSPQTVLRTGLGAWSESWYLGFHYHPGVSILTPCDRREWKLGYWALQGRAGTERAALCEGGGGGGGDSRPLGALQEMQDWG